MKKITLLSLICGLGLTSFSQVLLNETFSSQTPFPPTNWTSYEEDNNAMNTGLGLPAFINGSFQFGVLGGNGLAISSSIYDPRGTSDDWLITPQLSIPAASATETTLLTYFTITSTTNAPYDNIGTYELLVSTTGNAIADFTDVITVPANTARNAYEFVNVDLSTYAGEDIYIAFRDISTDVFVFAVDQVVVQTVPNDGISLQSVVIPEIAAVGDAVTITGTIANRGANNLTSFEVSWDDNTGSNLTTVTGVDIAPFTTAPFTHTVDLIASNVGNFTDVSVSVASPNGAVDSDVSDNTITQQLFVNNGTVVKRTALMEEFSTAPCQYCPDGAIAIAQVKKDNPDVIVVQHHAGFQTDGMTIPEHSTYAAAFTGGAPAAMFDRTYYAGNSIASSGSNGRPEWIAQGPIQAAVNTSVLLDIKGTYDNNSGIIDLEVVADFKDYAAPGDIRLTVFLVEDSVVETTGAGYQRDWDQVNAYYGAAGHPYQNVGTAGFTNPNVSWIEEYPHLDVVRDVWPASNAWGSDKMITSDPTPGDIFKQSVLMVNDLDLDLNGLSVVAFLSYYDATDVLKRKILNSTQVEILDLFGVGIDEVEKSTYELEVYPNPSSTVTNLKLKLNQSNDVEVRLFDITGKELRYQDMGNMSAGSQLITLDVADLSNGFYFVNLTVGEETITRKVSVNK